MQVDSSVPEWVKKELEHLTKPTCGIFPRKVKCKRCGKEFTYGTGYWTMSDEFCYDCHHKVK